MEDLNEAAQYDGKWGPMKDMWCSECMRWVVYFDWDEELLQCRWCTEDIEYDYLY